MSQDARLDRIDALFDAFESRALPRLFALGFEMSETNRYRIELSPDCIGWIGLNRASRGEVLEINPIVGITHRTIEDLSTSLGRSTTGLPMTWMTSIGYVLPEKTYSPLLMGQSRDIAPEVDALMQNMELWALPELRRLVDPAALADKLKPLNSVPITMRRFVAPLASYVAGDIVEADLRLTDEVERIRDRDTEDAQSYRDFARRLRELKWPASDDD